MSEPTEKPAIPADTRPEWLRNYEVGKGEVEYGGKKFVYTIVKRELEPRLPGFVGFANKELPDHLFISEEVPPRFRSYILRHEIREFTELRHRPNRCVEALKAELAEVPADLKPSYVPYRRNFFEKLTVFYKEEEAAGRAAPHTLVKNIASGLEYLRSYVS